MLAVLDESMRVFPPVPGGLPRYTAKGGGIIAGEFIPESVRLSFILPLFICYPSVGKTKSDSGIRPMLTFGNGQCTTIQTTGRRLRTSFQSAGLATLNSRTTREMRFSHFLRDLATVSVKSKYHLGEAHSSTCQMPLS